MTDASIPVDLFNPGQVFACLGFLEAADMLLGDAEGGFDWMDEANVRFLLRASGNDSPVDAVLAFLAESSVSALCPRQSGLSTAKWEVPTVELSDAQFPIEIPPSPATLPAVISTWNKSITLDHWGDTTERDAVKFWAGAGGYPGAALARDAVALIHEHSSSARLDPFSFQKPQRSSFRFDWRRDYIPIDAGFSPNDYSDLIMIGYPFVELLAAIGLGNARPERLQTLEYRYGLIGTSSVGDLHTPIFLRAALGCARLPFEQRFFRMHLGWPGQENQARCITNVTEDNQS